VTTWLARLNFLPGERAPGSAVVAQHLSALRRIRGVQQLDFHVDMNDEGALWAIWRLASYDDMISVYDDPSFKAFVSELKPRLVAHSVDNFILAALPASG
jgi:hypothetical protein